MRDVPLVRRLRAAPAAHRYIALHAVTHRVCLSSAGFELHQGSSGRGFTHVLMDEAAQTSEVSALVPLAQGCEKLVLVGDQAHGAT